MSSTAGGRVAKHVIRGVDLAIGEGETLGLVGESGCGKSTIGRAMLGLAPDRSGTIRFDGHDITALPRRRRRRRDGWAPGRSSRTRTRRSTRR